MKIRNLTREDVTIRVIPKEEDDHPKNHFEDKETIDYVTKEYEAGNIWAWCIVRVSVSWKQFEESEYLGGCSYKDEDDFKADGYYDDMVDEALKQLNLKIKNTIDSLADLEVT